MSKNNISIKRKDSKGRILRDRESQTPDGRYRYSYYENGKKKSFYSWKLEKNDPVAGRKKRMCIVTGTGKRIAVEKLTGC